MQLNDNLGHLTYCTNIHAGETWEEIFGGIQKHLPSVKAELSPNAPLGLGLRLSAAAGETLCDPEKFSEFQAFLKEGDYYIFTLNGFPYGTFHGQPIKEGAYRPDWSDPARLSYTNTLADHLVKWLPDGMEGSISTVPGTYKAWITGSDGPQIIEAIGDNIIRHVAHLIEIKTKFGKTINLALEPEPCCLIETIEETISFFRDHLFSKRAVSLLGELTGLSESEAVKAIRLHVGVCYDVCHAAVEFEDAQSSLDALKHAGIKISKLQLSSALRIPSVGTSTAAQLDAMNEPVYMHQVIEHNNGKITRFSDLPDALATIDSAQGAEWRIHFHVPIFLEEMQDLGTTQQFLQEVLAIHKADPVTAQLEVETYTWDVLPDEYRTAGLSTAIARELTWVRDRLV
ncbi:MAG: metabolite traffic protein EboE [Rhizobiaceae bacterium]|nr:metabolite traffic protein EboE [Rhizobiaceae bacterium]